MRALDTRRAKLVPLVSHIGWGGIEDHASVAVLAEHREFHTESIGKSRRAAFITAEALLREASLGDHKRNPSERDDRAAYIPRLRECELRGENE